MHLYRRNPIPLSFGGKTFDINTGANTLSELFSIRTIVLLIMCSYMACERSVGVACAHIIQMQIEQCLTMKFDKPNTVALVTSYVWKRIPLNKQVLYSMVQLGNPDACIHHTSLADHSHTSLATHSHTSLADHSHMLYMQFGKRITDETYYFSEAIGLASLSTIPI